MSDYQSGPSKKNTGWQRHGPRGWAEWLLAFVLTVGVLTIGLAVVIGFITLLEVVL